MKPEAEIDMKKLKETVATLNLSGLVAEKIRTVGVSKVKMAELFVAAVDALTDEQREQLGNTHVEVANYYNELIADELEAEVADAAGEEAPAGEATNDCPAFGTGWAEEAAECCDCLERYAEDYVQCKNATLAAQQGADAAGEEAPATVAEQAPAPAVAPATVAAKEEKAAAAEPPKKIRAKRTAAPAVPATPASQPAVPAAGTTPAPAAGELKKKHAELSQLGHRLDSMAGVIDKALLQPQGTTFKAIVTKLARDFNRSEDAAKTKFLGHVTYLKKKKGQTVTVTGEGDTKKFQIQSAG